MNMIAVAVVSVTSIGVICAVVLSTVSRFMAVKLDERVISILECLPGANCGACGFPGCSGYAEALVLNKYVKTNFCTPGGDAVSAKLSAILGVEAKSVEQLSAVVHCRGNCKVQIKKMNYKGLQSCLAAKQLYGGEAACSFGCLGYGDCMAVCPNHAVCMEDSLAHINTTHCTGCGLCVRTCPNNVISIENSGKAVTVFCNNIEKGALVRKKCAVGCIGCGRCARECSSEAITIKDNLARIDYEACTGCGRCAEVCVTGSIQFVRTGILS